MGCSLEARAQDLLHFHMMRWEEFPDFEVYSDQLIYLVDQVLKPLFPQDEKLITSTMIQNYVKWKVMPKSVKKKYGRSHMAYCIVISCLKPVLTIDEIKRGILLRINNLTIEKAYNIFCDCLEQALRMTLEFVIEPDLNCRFYWQEEDKDNLSMLTVCCSLTFKMLTSLLIEYHEKLQADQE